MPLTIGIISSQTTRVTASATFPLTQTSLYGVQADTTSWAAGLGFNPSILTYTWQVSSADSPNWTTVSVGNTNTMWFASASATPINVRVIATRNLTDYYNTTTTYLKPYSAPTDIPNLALWMDASDTSTITRTNERLGQWYFNGSNTNVMIPRANASSLFVGANVDFTIEAWVYPTVLPGTQSAQIAGFHEYGINTDWLFAISSTGTIGINIAGSWSASSTAKVTVNTWNHIAIGRSSSSIIAYVNGVSKNIGTNANTLNNNRGYPFMMGADTVGDESKFTGYISNFRFVGGGNMYGGYTGTTYPIPSRTLGYVSGTGTTRLLHTTTMVADINYANQLTPTSSGTGYVLPSYSDVYDRKITWAAKYPNTNYVSATYLSRDLPDSVSPVTPISNSLSGFNSSGLGISFQNYNSFYDPINFTSSGSQFFVYTRPTLNSYSFPYFGNAAGNRWSPLVQYPDGRFLSYNSYGPTIALTGVYVAGTSYPATMHIANTNLSGSNPVSYPLAVQGWSNVFGSINMLAFDQQASYTDAAMGEIIYTNTALPSDEVQQITKTLAVKWGL